MLVANKYSPNNFWSAVQLPSRCRPLLILTRTGRWRSQYTVDPSSRAMSGSIKVDVHYYEDGNVRLQTEKPVSASVSSSPSAADIVKQIAMLEKKYQEDLNRAFVTLSEGAFKNLRRQLPVTRQKVEWEKISGYRVCLPPSSIFVTNIVHSWDKTLEVAGVDNEATLDMMSNATLMPETVSTLRPVAWQCSMPDAASIGAYLSASLIKAGGPRSEDDLCSKIMYLHGQCLLTQCVGVKRTAAAPV